MMMRPAARLTIAAVIAVCGIALLSQLAMPSPGPIETEDIFASLEKPVAPRSRLPRARDFTSRSFTRPGMGNDSLVQKRHRLEAEKKLLEVRRSLFLPKRPLPAPPLSVQLHQPCQPPLNDEFTFVASQEKKQSLIDELQGKRDRAVVRTWRGAIQVPLPD